jgi:hypothetical protein
MTILKKDPIETDCEYIKLIPLAKDMKQIRTFVSTVGDFVIRTLLID